MASFDFKDRDGQNEYGIEASIHVYKNEGTIGIGVYEGDMDGNSYTAYVPNHRVAILNLIAELQEVLDATDGWDEGYDGFSFGHACATSTGESNHGNVFKGEPDGVVKHFG